MESKIHGNLRVLNLDIGGVFVIPAEGLSKASKDETSPLGLTLWADKVDKSRWSGR